MKNRIFNILIALTISTTIVHASDNVRVTSLEEFSTSSPAAAIDLKVLESSNIGEYILNDGDVIHCNVTKVNKPKRGKISAGFNVIPVYYIQDGKQINIESSYTGKYAAKILSKEEIKNVDAVQVGKKAALTVGNHFIKGVAPVAALAEGMIKNEDGNRIESGVKQVYKDSPLSYVEKGKDIYIHPGDSFYIKFKSIDDESDDVVEEN